MCTDLAELPGAWKPRQLVLVRLTFALTKGSSETVQNFISVKHGILSHFFFSSLFCPLFFTGIFRGIRCKRQATIGSGQVISWTSYTFTFLISTMTGRMPCSAVFVQPSLSTMASKAPTAAGSSASPDAWPLETLPSKRPTPPEALLQAAGDACTAL